MENKKNFLVVGLGIAGSMVTYFLMKSGFNVTVVDQYRPNTPSKVAAGLINPITGRKFLKSWKIDQLLPFAKQTYQEIDALLNLNCITERPIIRAIESVEAENDWLSRCGDPSYLEHINDDVDFSVFEEAIQPARAYGEVKTAFQVNIKQLTDAFRKHLQEAGNLLAENFDYRALRIRNQLHYREQPYDGIIFCEGNLAKENPYFNYLPFFGDKGEMLIIRIPGKKFPKSLKQQIFLLPIKEDLYWVGATYERNYQNAAPSDQGKAFLTQKLDQLLRVPYEIIDHQAAIRPTVRDRRPFIGTHPKHPHLHLFNGMGTKGTSLAPFWAKAFVNYLEGNAPLAPEVDIKRYQHFFETIA